jgi:hypothetical protein
VTAAYHPADGPAAGGDFYDVFALDDRRVGLIVGDVSGHGRGALPQTAHIRYTLRAYLEAGLPPKAAVQMAAPGLARQLNGTSVTVALAIYDPDQRQLTYSCAGHPPPIVVGVDHAPVTACSSPPIGMGLETGRRQTTVTLPEPATVCFYTDGVVDATQAGTPFGDARLERALVSMGPNASANAVLDTVASGTDRRFDDMAACILRTEDADASVAQVTVDEIELDTTDIEERGSLERFLRACGVEPQAIVEARESAARIAQEAGVAGLRVQRAGGKATVEVGGPLLRVLDPWRASGLS